MKMELNNRKRQIQDMELSCTSSTNKKKPFSTECNHQLQFLYDGRQQRHQVPVRRASTPSRAATPPLYVFENPPVEEQKQEATRSGTPSDTRRDSISSYENIVYMTHSTDDTPPRGNEPANQVRSHQKRDKQKHNSQFLAALDKELLLPDHLQSPPSYPPASCEKKEHKKNYSFHESATLPGGFGSPQQQSSRPMHAFNTNQRMMMTHQYHHPTSSSLHPASSYPGQVKKYMTAMIVIKEKKCDDDTNANDSTPPHEEVYDDHIKIWNDDEEQVRLERHFNPKWQVDFLSMFYGPEGKVDNDRTPSTNSPAKGQKNEKKVSNTIFKSIQEDKQKKTEEVILVDATNKDASNTDKSSSNTSSPLSLQEAAENLFDAMDVSDATRDAIARFEDQMQINRREFFSSAIRDIR
ncbi:predicted protein [Chaetoceros tenuissimus]|uniref:Uncharacterized protein n=1 Tax=Chaetoceros tenuissimus TaxID=426638 RepID=A0AAD3CEU4_9STRA|nr:predicted protein [Chaetoceros tenuissimus]